MTRETYSTILLSACKVDHKECPITYYKGHIKELCMCPCHPHAKPPIREPEPIVGIHIIP